MVYIVISLVSADSLYFDQFGISCADRNGEKIQACVAGACADETTTTAVTTTTATTITAIQATSTRTIPDDTTQYMTSNMPPKQGASFIGMSLVIFNSL